MTGGPSMRGLEAVVHFRVKGTGEKRRLWLGPVSDMTAKAGLRSAYDEVAAQGGEEPSVEFIRGGAVVLTVPVPKP